MGDFDDREGRKHAARATVAMAVVWGSCAGRGAPASCVSLGTVDGVCISREPQVVIGRPFVGSGGAALTSGLERRASDWAEL